MWVQPTVVNKLFQEYLSTLLLAGRGPHFVENTVWILQLRSVTVSEQARSVVPGLIPLFPFGLMVGINNYM